MTGVLWRRLCAVMVGLALSGCAAPVQVRGHASYVAPAFNQEKFEGSTIALLPIVAGAGVEGYRRPFGNAINASAAHRMPPGAFLSWQDTMQRLNEADLVEDYQQAITAYQSTSMVPRRLLRSMAEAVGVRYFLYVSLNPPTSSTTHRRSIWSNSMATDTHFGVSANGQVWSAEGDVVWEGVGSSEARAASDAFQVISVEDRRLEGHSQAAADALIRAVLGMPVYQ